MSCDYALWVKKNILKDVTETETIKDCLIHGSSM